MKSYIVEITETVVHEYTVDATSPEAAESIAEEWLDDGEEGSIVCSETLNVEATENEEQDEEEG